MNRRINTQRPGYNKEQGEGAERKVRVGAEKGQNQDNGKEEVRIRKGI